MLPILMYAGLVATAHGAHEHARTTVPGASHLRHLHPDLQRRLRAFAADAAAAGQPIKLISGYRRLDRGKVRSQGRASWHNFGLAVDFNLTEYSSMRLALDHYNQDQARWATLGRVAARHGLIWGGHWRREEIFHLEWHPGMPEGLRGHALQGLLAEAGPDGRRYRRTWHRFGGGTPKAEKRTAARRPSARERPRRHSARSKHRKKMGKRARRQKR